LLESAEAAAARWGVPLHEAWLANGLIGEEAYAAMLAEKLGVPVAGWDAVFQLESTDDVESAQEAGLPARINGRSYRVLNACAQAPEDVQRQAAALARQGIAVALASRFRIRAEFENYWRHERIDHAVYGLLRRSPVASAGGPIWTWQLVAAAVVVGLIAGGVSIAPDATIAALSATIALTFLCITLLRMVALHEVLFSAPARTRDADVTSPTTPDPALPLYSILVPLCDEANMLDGLVQSLRALDYPPPKLEILLVLEAADVETQAAVLALALPAHFRTIVVPDKAPRTKPKALNYALQFARGDYVVVYDAEDRPERGQLRLALAAFRRGSPRLGCVQAQLNIYNPRASWFTRQFTLEYSALFDAILPALLRLGLPVPLGGTSNHFLREALVDSGGWDPFNVTEDADLGFRLARQGWHTAVLVSTTWEEAPVGFAQWLRQRTRWLKGWMQTYLVHTRQPWRLSADLGLRGALGLNVLMGALILSALVHPLFYLLLCYHILTGQLFVAADTLAGAGLWTVAWVNLAAGYLTSILVGALSVWRRGRRSLALSALFMPLGWLLVSAAAYRALYQLVTAPYLWEKTQHGVPTASRQRRHWVEPARDASMGS
jgi:cellulose synthase/poly-beta-1,6-N-acetylglucosamine synthase-like glycosyltransferase